MRRADAQVLALGENSSPPHHIAGKARTFLPKCHYFIVFGCEYDFRETILYTHTYKCSYVGTKVDLLVMKVIGSELCNAKSKAKLQLIKLLFQPMGILRCYGSGSIEGIYLEVQEKVLTFGMMFHLVGK